jgi:hypothetical protein
MRSGKDVRMKRIATMQASTATLLAAMLLSVAACDTVNLSKTAERWCENAAHCVCTTPDCTRR